MFGKLFKSKLKRRDIKLLNYNLLIKSLILVPFDTILFVLMDFVVKAKYIFD